MNRPTLDDLVIDYLSEPSGKVTLCNVCASRADHGKGQLIAPVGYEHEGVCQGEFHNGYLCTPEEAKDGRDRARKRLGNFTPYDVCRLPVTWREEFAKVARVVLGGGE
jgi:hypothetical protein